MYDNFKKNKNILAPGGAVRLRRGRHFKKFTPSIILIKNYDINLKKIIS